jgi:hypothetical protein
MGKKNQKNTFFTQNSNNSQKDGEKWHYRNPAKGKTLGTSKICPIIV